MDKNPITHTAMQNDTYVLKIADKAFGKVVKKVDVQPAKKEGRTRKQTVFAFTPAEGFAIPETAARTMKELKAKLNDEVIPEDVLGALVAPLVDPEDEAEVQAAAEGDETPAEEALEVPDSDEDVEID